MSLFIISANTEAFYFGTVVHVFPGMEVLGKKKLARQQRVSFIKKNR